MTKKIILNLVEANGIVDFTKNQLWSNHLNLIELLMSLRKLFSFASSSLTNKDPDPSII